MPTNLEYRARDRQKKEKVGGRLAKLNDKKGRQKLFGFVMFLITLQEQPTLPNPPLPPQGGAVDKNVDR